MKFGEGGRRGGTKKKTNKKHHTFFGVSSHSDICASIQVHSPPFERDSKSTIFFFYMFFSYFANLELVDFKVIIWHWWHHTLPPPPAVILAHFLQPNSKTRFWKWDLLKLAILSQFVRKFSLLYFCPRLTTFWNSNQNNKFFWGHGWEDIYALQNPCKSFTKELHSFS